MPRLTAGSYYKSRMQFTLSPSDATEVDPTTVYFRYSLGGGSRVTLQYGVDDEIVRTDTGDYYVILYVTAGVFWRQWEGLGTNIGAKKSRTLTVPEG